ncbi:hypothetical protein C368_06947 [Cryptococcus neoformans 125.91]|nr:hypothetical protein C368_06947 [Cryptococcus neoformans var. grubii 125.91]
MSNPHLKALAITDLKPFFSLSTISHAINMSFRSSHHDGFSGQELEKQPRHTRSGKEWRRYSPSWPVDFSSPPPDYRSYSTSPVRTSRLYHSRSSPSETTRVPWRPPPPPPVSFPPPHYVDLARPSTKKNKALVKKTITPKLLVLDLNGALVWRNRSYRAHMSNPRPYLSCFLEYLFLPETPSDNENKPSDTRSVRPWEVFVWSSAQPHNVRAMVEGCFGSRWIEGIWEQASEDGKKGTENGEGRLLGVWARDKMGLKGFEYSRKVQTTKDLRKVLSHLIETKKLPDPTTPYSEKTIVLLDDSPLKAIFQPWNQIVIPEFDKALCRSSRLAAGLKSDHYDDYDDGDASTSQIGQGPEMDKILLAVIGILDQLRHVSNVPLWVRAGGLTFDLDETNLHPPTHESLPSHVDYQHWFNDQEVYAKWVAKGEEALERKGIEVRHGLDLLPSPPSRETQGGVFHAAPIAPLRSPSLDSREEREESYTRYSPSRPASCLSPSSSDDHLNLELSEEEVECTKSESAFARRKREERAREKSARKVSKGQQHFAAYAKPKVDEEAINGKIQPSHMADLLTSGNEAIPSESESDGKALDENDIESIAARNKAKQARRKQSRAERKVKTNGKERELEELKRERKEERGSGEAPKKRTLHPRRRRPVKQ